MASSQVLPRLPPRSRRQLAGLGLDPVLTVPVTVGRTGSDRKAGPEAAARQARYAALDQAAEQTGATAILLGHTLDDQAETVLLGLGRGSGARSLAGMAAGSGRYLRPLLAVRREQTEAACAALGLEPWDDPQNDDPAVHQGRRAPPADAGPRAGSRPGRCARPWPGRRRCCAPMRTRWTTWPRPRPGGSRDLPAAEPGRRSRAAHQAARAAPGRARGRLPGQCAVAAARAEPGRAGHLLARPALDGLAGRRPLPAPVWQAALHHGGGSGGRPPASDGAAIGGPGWTRMTWVPTSRRS